MSLQVNLKAPISRDKVLKAYTTFKIGGRARYFAEPASREELRSVLEFRASEGCPLFVLGRGSNILFSDEGYPGLVLSLRKLEVEGISFQGGGWVSAPAGMGLIQLNMACLAHGLSGVEFLCHIPGTVGGAVVMNAGFGRPDRPWQEMKDVVTVVTVMYLNGCVRILNRDEIHFEYRKTDLPQEAIVLEAVFHLMPRDSHLIQEEIKANFNYRNSVQDLRYPSAGSIFKNPSGCSMTSGQLLERVQMKNLRIGGAQVSGKHANFILNVDQAKATDVLQLMEIGRKRVFEEFGIELEAEVKYVGPER